MYYWLPRTCIILNNFWFPQGQIQGSGLGGWPPPSLGSLKLEIKKGNKTITEAILSRIVPISFCQVTGQSTPFQKSWIHHWFPCMFETVAWESTKIFIWSHFKISSRLECKNSLASNSVKTVTKESTAFKFSLEQSHLRVQKNTLKKPACYSWVHHSLHLQLNNPQVHDRFTLCSQYQGVRISAYLKDILLRLLLCSLKHFIPGKQF